MKRLLFRLEVTFVAVVVGMGAISKLWYLIGLLVGMV